MFSNINKTVFVMLGLFFLSIPLLQAQKMKFGKFKKEEWAMTTCPLDSNASAVVLFDVGKSSFRYTSGAGDQLIFERHTRIKILDKQGYDHASVVIPYYQSNGAKEKIVNLKASTYEMVGGKEVTYKLNKKDIFEENITENWKRLKFTLPNVKPGTIIEYSYQVTSDFFLNLQNWTFQSSIPIMWSEYETVIPEFYYYKRFFQGYIPFHINEETSTNGTISLGSGQPYTFRATRYYMVTKDVPAFKNEKFVSTPNDYLSRVYYQLATIKYPNSTIQNFSNSWKAIANNLRDYSGFGGQLKRTGAVKNLVSEITAGSSNPAEKIAKIYSYVQQNTKWNERYSYTSTQGIKKTLDEKSGSIGDINLLLITMLRSAGIQADPVILGARNLGRLLRFYPSEEKVNYVIALIRVDDASMFLDATTNLTPFGMLPFRCLSGDGYLIADKGQQWVSLQSVKKSSHTCHLILELDEEGKVQGDMQHIDGGYYSIPIRNEILSEGKEKFVKNTFSDASYSYNVTDFKFEQLENPVKPMISKYKIESEQQIAGDIIYLDAVLEKPFDESPFKQEKRIYPVDFGYPFSKKYILNLKIPEGYQPEELPEKLALALPDKGGRFTFICSMMNNSIQLRYDLSINKPMFIPDEYPALKFFFEKAISKLSEQIVLKKTESVVKE